uniref:Uncharacterized protein n=1 Tax=Siphoviridae sp. ctQkj3 TaxID=2825495 RepID=A0A8S5TVT6_9CAUD|nr:MAG TPA: hypothetical protein [Siphoviridae sp. ctQkj3]
MLVNLRNRSGPDQAYSLFITSLYRERREK